VTEPRSVRLALGALATCIAATALYAALRVVQSLLFREANPALVLWSEHAGFYWRAWSAAYAGGTVGFVAYVAAGRDAARTARVLSKALVVATLLLLAQGLLVP
jgi:hypothetical protein